MGTPVDRLRALGQHVAEAQAAALEESGQGAMWLEQARQRAMEDAQGPEMLRQLGAAVADANDSTVALRDDLAAVRDRLLAPARQRTRHRPGMWAAAGVGGLAVAALLLLGLRAQPLEVHVGDTAMVEGTWASAAIDPQELRFSDGSMVRAPAGVRVRVAALRAEGADVEVPAGRVHVHVVPREGNRWTVNAGPFTVHVLGTRFDVGWAPDTGRFELALERGKVRIEGPVLGERTLHAGERISVWPNSRRVVLEPLKAGPKTPAEEPLRRSRRVSATPGLHKAPAPTTRSESSAAAAAATEAAEAAGTPKAAEAAGTPEAAEAAEAAAPANTVDSAPAVPTRQPSAAEALPGEAVGTGALNPPARQRRQALETPRSPAPALAQRRARRAATKRARRAQRRARTQAGAATVATVATTASAGAPTAQVGAGQPRAPRADAVGAAVEGAAKKTENPGLAPPPATPAPDKPATPWALAADGHWAEATAAAEAMGWAQVAKRASAGELLAVADAARLTGRTGAAHKAYGLIRDHHAGAGQAAQAAFALGRLAMRANRLSEAARWFERYVQERPNGALAAQARGRTLVCRSKLADATAACRAAGAYLRHHPNGPRKALAQQVEARCPPAP